MISPPNEPPAEETVLGENTVLPGLTVARANPATIVEFGLPLHSEGVLITDAGALGPRAGLQAGDMIVAVNGTRIETSGEAEAALTNPGRRVQIDLIRGGRPISLRFRL